MNIDDLLKQSMASPGGQSAHNINNLPNVLPGDLSGANFATPQAARQSVYPAQMQPGGVQQVWMGGNNLGPSLAGMGQTAQDVPSGQNMYEMLAKMMQSGQLTPDQVNQLITEASKSVMSSSQDGGPMASKTPGSVVDSGGLLNQSQGQDAGLLNLYMNK